MDQTPSDADNPSKSMKKKQALKKAKKNGGYKRTKTCP